MSEWKLTALEVHSMTTPPTSGDVAEEFGKNPVTKAECQIDLGDGYRLVERSAVTLNGMLFRSVPLDRGPFALMLPTGKAAVCEDGSTVYGYSTIEECREDCEVLKGMLAESSEIRAKQASKPKHSPLPQQSEPTYTMQQAKPVSNVYRSDYIGINPTRPYLHDFRIGDIVRCLDSEPDLIDALSGQMFVRLARSGAYVNHESLTLVSTEYRLYTMQQAIYRIVDGLELPWVDYGELVRVENNWLGYFTVRSDKIIRPTGVTVEYVWGFRAHDGHDTPERPRHARGKCDSFESGKAACLEFYRKRFRAEIEKAVANGS